ncbi:hypothetical protein D3C78_1305150 [compost metagenome]
MPPARQPAGAGDRRSGGLACRQPGYRRDRGATAAQHRAVSPGQPWSAQAGCGQRRHDRHRVCTAARAPCQPDRPLPGGGRACWHQATVTAEQIRPDRRKQRSCTECLARRIPHPGLSGAGSVGAPRQRHGAIADTAGRTHQRIRRPVRRRQVVAGQQPAAGCRNPRRPVVRTVRPGHPHHHHRAVVPLPRRR